MCFNQKSKIISRNQPYEQEIIDLSKKKKSKIKVINIFTKIRNHMNKVRISTKKQKIQIGPNQYHKAGECNN